MPHLRADRHTLHPLAPKGEDNEAERLQQFVLLFEEALALPLERLSVVQDGFGIACARVDHAGLMHPIRGRVVQLGYFAPGGPIGGSGYAGRCIAHSLTPDEVRALAGRFQLLDCRGKRYLQRTWRPDQRRRRGLAGC
ncbi:hypothetical protein [Methylobacterium nodulans]|uniref:Uncharacterized protein n=1 Tax=Methylobacterium nodulans (strain LMG 21967 / CNCM I-2342 / ORS 2060) TaxID=460265 RepID=B8IGG5_METNO|nr:hypothetical protein [Methylobacterium nodulans]ACL55865.1 hypothetical protein Mnod_0837 [Methylobacterium nodulans ORS 2060]